MRGGAHTVRLTPDVERTVRRYILGDLEEGLRPELEELLITDPDAFEALGVIEDELIEEYLEETGSQEERRSFELHFLTSPEGMRRLRFARALRSRASTPILRPHAEARAKGSWLGLPLGWRPAWVGLAAALAASLLGNVWLASQHRGLDNAAAAPSGQERPLRVPAGTRPTALPAIVDPALAPTPFAPSARIEEARAEGKGLVARLELEQHERARAEARVKLLEQQVLRSGVRVATFALAAGLLRGEGSLARVKVPADAVAVELRLELPAVDYPRYRAALLDANGDEVWIASKLRAEGEAGQPAVVLLLPSGLLPPGDYQVKLSGSSDGREPETLGTYAFRASPP